MGLKKKFQQPAGFQWGSFKNKQAASIRYGFIKPKQKQKGTLVLGPGYGEPIEKFFETIRDLTKEGYAVWAIDWRGQGGSDPAYKDEPQKPYGAKDFIDHNMNDLKYFSEKIVKKNENEPLIYMGFSLGGHIGLRFLKEHEGVFDSAILNAPMIDFETGALPRISASLLSKFMMVSNSHKQYIHGGSDWYIDKDKFDENGKTSDPERHKVQHDYYLNNEKLRVGSQTFEWIYHADQSIKKLTAEAYLKSIKTPIKLITPTADRIVSVAAQQRAAKLLPNVDVLEISDARHEISMEHNKYRTPWFKAVKSFLATQLKKKPSSKPKIKKCRNPSKH